MKRHQVLAVLSTLFLTATAFAERDISCVVSKDQGTFDISVTANDKVSTGQDGGELGADYEADKAKDSTSYVAFKITDKSQDGEQPAEIKIARKLLTGKKGTKGAVWMAPGIVGGTFSCSVAAE